MTSVTVGNSSSATLSATSTVTVTPTTSTGVATVTVVRGGANLYNRQIRNAVIIGPYLENDVVTVRSDTGTTVYTVDAYTAAVADVGFANPMTGTNDLIGGGTSGAPARLAHPATSGAFTLQVVDGTMGWTAGANAGFSSGDVLMLAGAGAPVDYTDGSPPATGEATAGIGSLYVDTTGGKLYINGGTKAQPLWKIVTSA
jgi:hypothetical protein